MLNLELTLNVHLIQLSSFMNVTPAPVTLYRLSKFAVLHISNHYIETKMIILYLHDLDKVVEEMTGCKLTENSENPQGNNKRIIGYFHSNFTLK